MAGVTVSGIANVLKEWYHGQRVRDLTLKSRPLLDMMTKDTGFGGSLEPILTAIAAPQGFASTFAESQANDSGSEYIKFNFNVGYNYGTISFSDRALTISRNEPHSFLKTRKAEMDRMLNQFGNILAYQLWGNGGGSIGRRSGGLSGNTITLTNPQDAHNFEKGMRLRASPGDGSGASDALRAGNAATVTSVNRAAGTVTVDNAASITSFTADDYLFRDGIFAGNVSQIRVMKGIQSWLPAVAPTVGDSHYDVDRSVDDRLYGFIASEAGAIDIRLRKAAAKHNSRYDGTPEHGFLHPEKWEELSLILQSQGFRPIDVKAEGAAFGYKALEQVCPYGTIKWISDRFCPTSRGFMLDLARWKLKSAKELIHIQDADGQSILRKGSVDDYEIRAVSYANPCTDDPRCSASVSLT